MNISIRLFTLFMVLSLCSNAVIAQEKNVRPLVRSRNRSDGFPQGAQSAELGEFPHYSLLGWFRKDKPDQVEFHCGGALISERFVLTAAHCLKKGPPDFARLGDASSNDSVDFEVENYFRHEEHKMDKSYHDIALIKLKRNVTFSFMIRPACLWTGLELNVSTVISAGFGTTDPEAYAPTTTMKKINLDLLDRESCRKQFRGDRKLPKGISDDQLCVGSLGHRSDACVGDSGGPLVVRNDPNNGSCPFHVVAISSRGAACGEGNSAAVCTTVAAYRGWIERNARL